MATGIQTNEDLVGHCVGLFGDEGGVVRGANFLGWSMLYSLITSGLSKRRSSVADPYTGVTLKYRSRIR